VVDPSQSRPIVLQRRRWDRSHTVRPTGWLWVLLLISLIAFGVVRADTATQLQLRWTAPTQNTDGTALTDLAGFRIYYGNTATTLDHTVQVVGAAVTSFAVPALPMGTWYFGVSAYTASGSESDKSNVVNISTCGPAPNPATRTTSCPAGYTGTFTQTAEPTSAAYPTCWAAGPWLPSTGPVGACTAISLKTIETIAYKLYGPNANKSTFVRVGTFAAPVACTAAVFTDLAGVSRHIIQDRNRAVLDGTVRPLQVYAKCAVQ
jgi:hypothetical protein